MKTRTQPKTRAKLPLPSKQYMRDVRWIGRHYKKLSLEHSNKWIAVHKGHIVAVGDDSGSVKRRAQEQTGFLEIPVEFMGDATIFF